MLDNPQTCFLQSTRLGSLPCNCSRSRIMGTSENDGNWTSFAKPKPEPEEPELRFSSPDLHNVDALIEKLDNVVLKSDEIDTDKDGEKDSGILNRTGLLPLRPYGGDCPHFIRNGSCKFGVGCRYNHPEKRTQAAAAKDLDKDLTPEDSGSIECKYYRTPRGCKYGKSCRYLHHGEESENTVHELNFLGLPIRLGEKECPFYMRNGTCGYGSRCVFNHPDPTPLTESGSVNSSMDDKFGRQLGNPLGKQNGVSLPVQFSRDSKPELASRLLPAFPDDTASYSHSPLSYITPHAPSQQMQKQSKRNGYQAPNFHQSGQHHSTPSADGSLGKSHISMQDDEFPERPGHPECAHFVKTGNCKFKSACRYHHPTDRKSKPDECILSQKGLPLRPGRSICRHYERQGICKFGNACLFDHPVSEGLSANHDWHASKVAVDYDARSWGN